MRKFWVLIAFLLLLALSSVAFVDDGERALYTTYLDYAGAGPERIHEVGIEKVQGEYFLKYYLWENNLLTQDISLRRSTECLLWPELAFSSDNVFAVSYLKDVNGQLLLHLESYYHGEWRQVNGGNPLTLDQSHPVETVKMAIAGDDLYLAYLQNQGLRFVKVDMTTGSFYELYRQELGSQSLNGLKLTILNGDLLFGYTVAVQGQLELRTGRVRTGGFIDCNKYQAGVNSFDLVQYNGRFYLATEVLQGAEAQVTLWDGTDGVYNQMATLRRNDLTPEGLKLLACGNELQLLYREQGVNRPFRLELARFTGNGWSAPDALRYVGTGCDLWNLREGMRELGATALCLTSENVDWRVERGVPSYRVVDLRERVPAEVLQAGVSREHVQSQPLVANLAPAQVRNLALENPGGVACDAKGYIYLADAANGKVWVLHPDGQMVNQWQVADQPEVELTDLVLDGNGYLYLVDRANARILRYTVDGELVQIWGADAAVPGAFQRPVAMAIDGWGNLYVLDQGSRQVLKFDSRYNALLAWGQFAEPAGIAVDATGRVYVADAGSHQVQVFDANGELLAEKGSWGADGGQLREPVDLCIDRDWLYIADRGNQRIQVWNLELTYLYEYGVRGSDWGEFRHLNQLALDSVGNLYITDALNHSLQKVAPDGYVLRGWHGGDIFEPHVALESVGVIGQTYYFWNTEQQRLLAYDAKFNFKGEVDLTGQEERLFAAFTCDASYFYLTDLLHDEVVIYDLEGNFLSAFGGRGALPGFFASPQGICVDPDGAIYVADTGNHRVQKFTAAGVYLTHWGEPGTVDGQLVEPRSVVWKDGNLLVADLALDRVQAFTADGDFVQKWNGLGTLDGQMPYEEYLARDIEMKNDVQLLVMSYNFNIENDYIPKKSKLWLWEDKFGYRYRYTITSSQTSVPDGGYENISSATVNGGNGVVYLHIQAALYVLGIRTDESEVQHFQAVLDNTPPTVQMPANLTSPQKSVTLSWTGTDLLNSPENRLTYKFGFSNKLPANWTAIDNSVWNSLTFSASTMASLTTGTGQFYLVVQACDTAGNISSYYWTSVMLDNTRPVISNCTVTVEADQTLRFTAVASDLGSTAGELQYRFLFDQNANSVPVGTYSSSTIFSADYKSGTNYIHVQVRDAAGNESTVFTKAIDLADIIPPTIHGLSDQTVPVQQYTWHWSAEDDMDSAEQIRYAYSITPEVPGVPTGEFGTTVSYELKNRPDGKYYLNVRAKDLTGNISDVKSVYVILDTTAPVLNLSKVVFSGDKENLLNLYTGAVQVEVPATAYTDLHGCTVEYKLNNDSYTTYTGSFKVETDGMHTLYVRVTDAAGNWAEGTLQLGLDKTPPALTTEPGIATLANTWYSGVKSVQLLANDPLAGVAALAYNLDQAGWQGCLNGDVVNISGDGVHQLQVKVDDLAGNSGIIPVTVRIDSTPPVMGQITSEAFPVNTWTYLKSGQFSVSATDTLSGVGGYQYLWNDVADYTAFAAGSYQTATIGAIQISGLTNGVSYLHVRPVDLAGNVGDVLHYKLMIADETPAIPVILSDTHANGASSFYTRPHFYWKTPDAGSLDYVGITGYEYLLKRVLNDTEDVLYSQETGVNEIWLPELQPLAPADGYYQFDLRAVNGAGRKSGYATLRFNVTDYAGDEHLLVFSDTHPSTVKYYNNKQIQLRWNQPPGLVGGQFYDQFGTEATNDPEGWAEVIGQEKTLSISEPISGEYYYWLKGVSGETVLTSPYHKICLDFEKPEMPNFEINLDPLQKTATVYWGSLLDIGGSNLSEVRIQLMSEGDQRGTFKVSTGSSEFTCKDIQPDENYRIEIEVRDGAGNRRIKVADFNLLTGINYSVGESSDLYLDNWQVCLTKYLGQIIAADVMIPGAYDFKCKNGEMFEPAQKISFVEFEADETNFSAWNHEILYQINLSGQIFYGQGVYINPTGLYLQHIWLSVPEDYWYDSAGQLLEENKQLNYPDVKLTANSGNQVVGSYSDNKLDCINFTNWLLDISHFTLTQSGLQIVGAADLSTAYVSDPVPFSAPLDADRLWATAALSQDYELALPGGSVLTVKESELTQDLLIVKRAELIVQGDGEPVIVEIGNFVINSYGDIFHLESFYSTEFSFVYQGVTYEVPVNGLGFEENTLYIIEGSGRLPGSEQKIPVAYIPLNNQGEVLIPAGAYFTHIELFIHDIRVEAFDGIKDGDSIIFEKAKVYLPVLDGFDDPVILELRNLPYGVNGFDFSNVTIYTPYFNYARLGSVKVTGIAPNLSGLTLNGEIQLNGSMPEGLRYRTLTLNPFAVTAASGITAELTATIPWDVPLTICNTLQFSATTLYLRTDEEVKSIYFTGGTMQFIGAIASQVGNIAVVSNIVEIDYRGRIRQFDTGLLFNPFVLKGITVKAHSLEIDADYIYFIGEGTLPNTNGLTLPVYSLKLNHATGEIDEFYLRADEPAVMDLYGWELAVSGVRVLGDGYSVKAALKIPEELSQMLPDLGGRYIRINELIFTSNGMVKKLDVMVPYRDEIPLSGDINLIVKDPGIILNDFDPNAAAITLKFAQAGVVLPPAFGGGILAFEDVSFNSHGDIDYGQVSLSGYHVPFLESVGVSVLINHATFSEDGLHLKGTVTLGDNYPDGLKGRTFLINDIHITDCGVQNFDVGIPANEPFVLYNAIAFSASHFKLGADGFTILDGRVSFAGGLGAGMSTAPTTSLALHKFRIESGQIVEFDVEVNGFTFPLLGSTVGVDSIQFTNEQIAFAGSVTLPEQMPGQLSSLKVNITSLVMNYDGTIAEYSVSLANPVKFGLNGLDVTVNTLTIANTGYTLGVNCTIPSAPGIPEGLREKTITTTLTMNHSFEISNFEASILGQINFAINKLKFELTQLTFTKTQLKMVGSIVLPDTYPEGLKNERIQFQNVVFDYLGGLISTDISVASLDFTIGSYMDAKIKNLALNANNGQATLSASGLDIMLKNTMSTTLSFTNVSLNTQGNFSASVAVGVSFDVGVAGATLRLTNPTFDGTMVCIASAKLILPQSLGGKEVGVNDVRISPSEGLKIGGGEFALKFPDMAVGEVGIKDTYMALKIVNSQYIFEGKGSAQIPGIGAICAEIKLRSVTPQYITGIERIALSLQTAGLGLPLGATGLYINGIYGEFQDGPVPADAPSVVKQIGDGMKFNLGVYVTDLSGGLKGNAGFWVNISNSNAAITGKLSILNSLFSADVYAAVRDHFADFYAECEVTFSVIKGKAQFHVWKANSKSYLAGSSTITVDLEKGKLFHKWGIYIPSDDWTSPSLNAEFGDFKNGEKGVKGYIGNLPIIGQIGFFAGSTFKIGGVSEYVLMTRAMSQFRIVTIDPFTVKPLSEQVRDLEGNFIIEDKEYVSFDLPGQAGLPRNSLFALTASPKELQNYYVQSTERVIFAVGFAEGDPDIVAIAPDGLTQYTKDSEGVEYQKEANQILMSIENPVPGLWHLVLENARGLDYQVAILGTTPKPELVFTAPTKDEESGTYQYTITGRGGVFTGQDCFVDLYYDTDDQNYDGRLIAEHVSLHDYSFSQLWDTSLLAGGEYYIYGKLYDDSDLPPVVAYADGSVYVLNHSPIVPPDQVNAVKVDNAIQVSWQVVENPNIIGYMVYYGIESGQYPHSLNVGKLGQVTLPLIEGESCYIAVAAYNQGGVESAYSAEVSVNLQPREITYFDLSDVTIPVTTELYIGEGIEVQLPYLASGTPSGTEGDYLIASLEGLPVGVYANFDQPMYYLYSDNPVIKLNLFAEERSEIVQMPGQDPVQLVPAAPGSYTCQLILRSAGNAALNLTRELTVQARYRAPLLHSVSPQSGINQVARELILLGDNFREGVEVRLGEEALEVKEVNRYQITVMVPADYPGGVYDLQVVQDDGQTALLRECYEVLQPDYQLVSLQSRVLIGRGGIGSIYLTSEAIHEYAGQICVEARALPAGIITQPVQQMLAPGEECSFVISVDYAVEPGLYSLTFAGDDAHQLQIPLEVVDGEIQPQVESFNRPFALTTESIIIYGQGFGHTGQVDLNGVALDVISWSYNRIECLVPEGATSGLLRVTAGGKQSTPVELLVKEKKYSVNPGTQTVLICRGESAKLNFAITGYSDPVDFTVEGLPVGMTQQFLNLSTGIVPNYTLQCLFNTSPGMELGVYTLQLVGHVNGVEKSYAFDVTVADLPRIENQEFAEGRVGVTYQDWVDVHGGFSPYKYEVLANSLPGGLRMDTNGQLTGTPVEPGRYEVSVQVTDRNGAKDSKVLNLNILGNEWIYPEYDPAGSSRTLQKGPASGEPDYAVPVITASEWLLSSENWVVGIGDSTVRLYAKDSGVLADELSLDSAVVDAVVLKDSLLLLGQDGKLHRYSYATGEVDAVQCGLTGRGQLFLYRDRILVIGASEVQIRAKDDLTLVAEWSLPFARNSLIRGVFDRSTFCYVSGQQQVVALDLESGIQQAAVFMPEAVVDLTMADGRLYVVMQNGRVQEWNWHDDTLRFVLDAGRSLRQFIPYKDGYVVSGEGGLDLYGVGGKPFANLRGEVIQTVVAGNRLYVMQPDGLSAYKLSNLNQVWHYAANGGGAMLLSNHQLYSIAGGTLYKFAGPTNVYAPETMLLTKPEKPTGDNGYYTEKVVLYLEATDRDNEVLVTYYAGSNGEYAIYDKGVMLDDGIHNISYYSMDEDYKLESTKNATFYVDATPPEVNFYTEPVAGVAGFYTTPVVSGELSAMDSGSGVAQIYYQLDDGEVLTYDGTFQVSGEGTHRVTYYAVDLAGNTSVPQTMEIKIDTTTPTVAIAAEQVDGEAGYYRHAPVVLTLSGEDNYSGLGEMYYQIDEQGYVQYANEILVSGDGSHRIEYYAVDVAGNKSAVSSYALQVDTTAPSVTLTAEEVDGANGYYIHQPVLIWLTGADAFSGIKQIYYRLDDGEDLEYRDGIEVLQDGEHLIEYYAVDRAGNVAEVQGHTVKIDTTAPVTTLSRIKPLMNGVAANIRLATTDAYAGVTRIRYTIDGSPEQSTMQDIFLTEPGYHTVRYYAEDAAGNLEAEHVLTYTVQAPDEVEWIEDVVLTEFHNALTSEQHWELDRSIEVGDKLYLDEEYIFEQLPDYLAQTWFIRGSRHANKTGYNDYYLHFDTLMRLNVYLVVESSIGEVPGFTLFGQTRFANRMHFSADQNVFLQQVSGSSTIRIPGSQLLDTGHAPLIFIAYAGLGEAPYSDIEMLNSRQVNGNWYLDMNGSGFDLGEGMLEGKALTWSYRVNGQETGFATGESAQLPVRFEAEPYWLEICLTATNTAGIQGVAKRIIRVEDQSGVYILQPQDQDHFQPDELMTCKAEVKDEMGNPLLVPIQWALCKPDTNWVEIGSGNELLYTLPNERGAYLLRARAGEWEHEVKFEITKANGGKEK